MVLLSSGQFGLVWQLVLASVWESDAFGCSHAGFFSKSFCSSSQVHLLWEKQDP